jgi:hypothetical protein
MRKTPTPTLDEMHATFAARDRFEMFMGDWRATRAILCEAAVATIPGTEPTVMDVEDFTRFIKGRVDVHGMPAHVLRAWDVI